MRTIVKDIATGGPVVVGVIDSGMYVGASKKNAGSVRRVIVNTTASTTVTLQDLNGSVKGTLATPTDLVEYGVTGPTSAPFIDDLPDQDNIRYSDGLQLSLSDGTAASITLVIGD